MEENKLAWDLVVTNPAIVTGPLIHPISGPESVNAVIEYHISNLINGTHSTVEGLFYALYHQVCFFPTTRFVLSALLRGSAPGIEDGFKACGQGLS